MKRLASFFALLVLAAQSLQPAFASAFSTVGGGTGTGTVTSVGVTTVNGVSGTVANPTTTPAITVTLGAITPSSVAATGNVTAANLGTASAAATGTSGHTLGFLDGANTFSGNQIMSADLTIAHASSNSVLYLDPGTGTYSEIQLKGTNGSIGYLPNGLDILAGSANVYLSGDNFNFRNAATTTPILTMSTTSATFNGTLAASNLSGTNTGNQTITLTSDVTGSGTGSFATTIAGGAVSLAKMANLAANSIIGNNTASPATPLALTTLPTSTLPAMTGGDVTSSAGSTTLTIGAGKVTTTQMANLAASSLLGNPTGSPAAPSAITLAGGLTFSGTTLTAAGALTPTSVASTGAISGTTVAASSSILSSGATNGIGYSTGAGGTATQGTSRVTGVTINKACGAITIFSAAGAATYNTFTVTDSAVAATDTIVINQKSGTNLYIILITAVGAGTFNVSFATTGGTATDAPVFNYCAIKGVAA